MARSASLEALAHALEAPTDFGAVVSALGSTAVPEAALALDPFADVIARGIWERERLARLAGGLLSAAEVGRALGISPQAVDKRRRGNRLLAVRVSSDWRYPAAQIGAYGEVAPALPLVLQDASVVGRSGWTLLDFLLAPDDALGGLTPLESLRRGGAEATVVRRILAADKVDAYG